MNEDILIKSFYCQQGTEEQCICCLFELKCNVYMSFWALCPASVECNKNGISFENHIYDLMVSVESARVLNYLRQQL